MLVVWLKTLSRTSVQSGVNCDILIGLFTVSQFSAKHSGTIRDYFFSNDSNTGFCAILPCVESSLRHPSAGVSLEACIIKAPSLTPYCDTGKPPKSCYLLGVLHISKNYCHVLLYKNQHMMLIQTQHKRTNPSHRNTETIYF